MLAFDIQSHSVQRPKRGGKTWRGIGAGSSFGGARRGSRTNGIRLYVNGTLNDTTDSIIYLASGLVNILTLADRLQGIQASAGDTCNSQSMVPNVYFGDMDEFRVYSRELNASDVHTLAKP